MNFWPKYQEPSSPLIKDFCNVRCSALIADKNSLCFSCMYDLKENIPKTPIELFATREQATVIPGQSPCRHPGKQQIPPNSSRLELKTI